MNLPSICIRLSAKAVAGGGVLGGILFSCQKNDEPTLPIPCRITNDGTFAYTYDAQGRPKRFSQTSHAGTYTFLSARNLLIEETIPSVLLTRLFDVTLNEKGLAVASTVKQRFGMNGTNSTRQQTFVYDGADHLNQYLEAIFNEKGVLTDSVIITLTFEAGNLIKVNRQFKKISSVGSISETMFYGYVSLIENTLPVSTLENRLSLDVLSIDQAIKPFLGKSSRHTPTKVKFLTLPVSEAVLTYETDDRQNIIKVIQDGSEQFAITYDCP
jgi:hypothetical protein